MEKKTGRRRKRKRSNTYYEKIVPRNVISKYEMNIEQRKRTFSLLKTFQSTSVHYRSLLKNGCLWTEFRS